MESRAEFFFKVEITVKGTLPIWLRRPTAMTCIFWTESKRLPNLKKPSQSRMWIECLIWWWICTDLRALAQKTNRRPKLSYQTRGDGIKYVWVEQLVSGGSSISMMNAMVTCQHQGLSKMRWKWNVLTLIVGYDSPDEQVIKTSFPNHNTLKCIGRNPNFIFLYGYADGT